jgi:chemotaxis response regulator CheB
MFVGTSAGGLAKDDQRLSLLPAGEMMGPRAVAVILSGLDHDGSAAPKAIKAAGGVTLAQSDASCGDMPSPCG